MGLCYSLERITDPAVEPVTLAEAKLYLRVDHSDEDTLISELIVTARQAAENYLQQSLITQEWKMSLDDYAPSTLPIPMGPVQAVDSVVSITRLAVSTTLSVEGYYLGAATDTLYFDAAPLGHQVDISYTAGYGDASTDVPEGIRTGIKRHTGLLYEDRSLTTLHPEIQSLYVPYRRVRL